MRDRILFEHELAVVSILHNESRYVGEWLEYHYRLGVDKFYIYDIESEDRAELVQILKRMMIKPRWEIFCRHSTILFMNIVAIVDIYACFQCMNLST